jgi:hypothetical protein
MNKEAKAAVKSAKTGTQQLAKMFKTELCPLAKDPKSCMKDAEKLVRKNGTPMSGLLNSSC